MTTVRHADAETARGYPLPVPGPAPWRRHPAGRSFELELPRLAPGTILVPSLASAEARTPANHQWTLTAGEASWPLQPVPPVAGAAPTDDDAVSTHIDCFHVHRQLDDARLRLVYASPDEPRRYLACVSARPLTVADPPCPARSAGLREPPPPLSQLTAPAAIANRICSPTCVSMVLRLWQHDHDWPELAQECLDPVSGMYGVWPLALAAAARHGSLGAVEAFSDWTAPLAVLERGIPLVTSIRFAAGALPGAPLNETGGHLLVVYRASPRSVAVCDPAAPTGEVLREYPAAEFSRAWLRHRGAAYILPP